MPRNLFPEDLLLDFLWDRSEFTWPVVPWIVLLTFLKMCAIFAFNHLGITNHDIEALTDMIFKIQ